MRCRKRRDSPLDAGDCGTTRNGTEPFGDQGFCSRDIDVARQHQNGIVGAIFCAKPILCRFQGGGTQISHRADCIVAIGVSHRKQRAADIIVRQAEGLVITLPFFILDNADLVIELFLRNCPEQMAHAIGFEEEHGLKRRRRHGLEIIGPVVPSRAVEIGRADLLQRLEDITRRVFGAVEHQLFKQMCETGLSLRLVLRPDVVIDRGCHDRRFAVGVDDDAQAIRQRELLIGNVHLGDERGNGRGLVGSPSGSGQNQSESKTGRTEHQTIL